MILSTHNNDLVPFAGVSDDDALDLLVEALHTVPEARRGGLGDGDWHQDGLRHLGLRDKGRERTGRERERERKRERGWGRERKRDVNSLFSLYTLVRIKHFVLVPAHTGMTCGNNITLCVRSLR